MCLKGRNAEHGKIICRHARTFNLPRFALAGHGVAVAIGGSRHGGHILETLGPAAPVFPVEIRKLHEILFGVIDASGGVGLPSHDDSARLRKGKGFQNHGIEHATSRRLRQYRMPARPRKLRGSREICAACGGRRADVLEEGFEPGKAAEVVLGFAELRGAPEAEAGLAAGFVGREAAADVPLGVSISRRRQTRAESPRRGDDARRNPGCGKPRRAAGRTSS